ncbi:MAG TPA: alpha/beta fold hydrolase, partial [Nocardioides sp.]|nr:alpha/beta fold hydrolase [Nocardioides sp.]
MARSTLKVEHVTVHGHRRAYVRAGSGPVVLLLHGLGCDHTTWAPVIASLSRTHTVIAPDLLGHGSSDKPRADYSLGGYANGMRDLLTVLGVDTATVVGHSFGGGVAMQFGYQYPERTERLVLVASGGLGPEVNPAIRAITTPGFHQVMGVLAAPGLRHAATTTLRVLSRSGIGQLRDLAEVAAIYDSFKDPRARAAIRHVVRAVVDWKGQIVTMADRAYLTEAMPMCVVWGADDLVIPVSHA